MTASNERSPKPLLVYGSSISYFTGKLEGYLRYKEIPYQLVPMTPLVRNKVGRRTGATQMPPLEGRFSPGELDRLPLTGRERKTPASFSYASSAGLHREARPGGRGGSAVRFALRRQSRRQP
jgi:hypothetical protein